jgi:hypothetical protein
MSSFNDNYTFANTMRTSYGKYTKQSFAPMEGKTFKTGRQKYVATFTTDNRVYRHEAMQGISKAGKPYYNVNNHTLELQALHEANRERDRKARDDAREQALVDAAGVALEESEVEYDEEEEVEDPPTKPDPLSYQTRDFKQGHVEHE